MKQILLYLCIVMIVFLAPGKANATPILDQANPSPGSASGAEVRASLVQAQTFQVGISGQLTGLELYTGLSLNNPVEDLIIEIRTTESGLPTNNRLAFVILPPEKVGRWSNDLTLVDLTSAQLFVDSGDLLAIVLSSTSTLPRYYNWWGNIGNLYGSGTGYKSSDGGLTWMEKEQGNFDMHFWTYVDTGVTAPVPEPATLLLFGSGLLGFIGLKKYRKR